MTETARKQRVLDAAGKAWAWLPVRLRHRLLKGLVRLEGAAPGETGLRNLLGLVDPLEESISHAAMRREGGIHPKHRLIRYHDFFVSRIRPGEVVVDVGCGYGAVAHSIATRAGATVYGIDISAANVAEARRRWPHERLQFMEGDALEVLPAERCDVVVLSNVLEHIEHRPAFLQRLVAALRPSRLLIRVPAFDRHWNVPLRAELGMPYFNDPTHYAEHPAAGWLAEFREGGLTVTDVECRWGEVWAECRVPA